MLLLMMLLSIAGWAGLYVYTGYKTLISVFIALVLTNILILYCDARRYRHGQG